MSNFKTWEVNKLTFKVKSPISPQELGVLEGAEEVAEL
jgi:hypothetical protein